MENGSIVLVQYGHEVAVPAGRITAISYGSDVRRGITLLKSETGYVGVAWSDDTRKHEVLFRLGSREYHEFVPALEALTGKKAVDAHKVPTVVDYGVSAGTL